MDHGGDLSSYSEQGKSPGKVLSRGWTGCELGSNKTPLAECGEWKEKDRWEGGEKVHKKRTYWCGVPQIDGSVADGGTVSAQERTG